MAIQQTGLEFRGNINSPSPSPSSRFVFNADEAGSTDPFAAYPATYIWRAYPRSGQPISFDSFWTMLFHADYVTTFTGTEQYYGMHPFPDIGETPDRIEWEISAHGVDFSGGDSNLPTEFDRWHTCVAIVRSAGGTEFEDFYWDWPDQATKIIQVSGAAVAAAANPCIVVGDAPWNLGFENMKGVLRGFQYYDTNLSLAQVQQEIDNPGSFRAPWYINLNPTPDDIRDKSGAGHHPVWVGGRKAALWTEDTVYGVLGPPAIQQRMR